MSRELLRKINTLPAVLKAYFDTLYQPVRAVLTNTTASFTTALKDKLDAIASGATSNATDAQLRDRTTHTGEQAQSTVTGLVAALASKATPSDIATAISNLVASSPATLDTLDELANALGDDPNFATTIATALGQRLRLDTTQVITAAQKLQGQTNLGVSPYVQTLLDDADQATAKATLGVDPITLDARYGQTAGPTVDGGQSFGAAARRWLSGFFKALTVSHDSANATLAIDAPSANTAAIEFRKAGVRRFLQYVNPAAMFAIGRYDATGAFLGNALTIDPSSGQVSLSTRPLAGGALVETQDGKGVANGYAPLGADNLVPSSFLPVSGSYLGTWNASTNTPTLTTTPAANGAFYIVSVAGTQSVTGTSTAFAIGDQLRSNGTAWQRIPNSNAVPSVFGRTGPISAANGDYNATQITYGATTVSAALDLKAALSSPAFTGTPTAPTAPLGTNTTQIATMAALKAGLDVLEASKQPTIALIDTLEVSGGLTGDRYSSVDLHSSDGVDFSARMIRDPGVNGAMSFVQTGSGLIRFYGSSGMTYNDVPVATVNYVTSAINAVIAAAPGALDTLDELAAALGDDPNFRTTILNAIAQKEATFDIISGGTY